MVSRICFATARSSLLSARNSLNVSFSIASSSRREVLAGLILCGVGLLGRLGITGSVLRSGLMYLQVSPPSAMVFMTKSQGS
jgi:hypothetical protein